MPNDRKNKYGLTKAPSSYQKGGSKYQEGTVGGKPYEGERFYDRRETKIIKTMEEATDPTVKYKMEGVEKTYSPGTQRAAKFAEMHKQKMKLLQAAKKK